MKKSKQLIELEKSLKQIGLSINDKAIRHIDINAMLELKKRFDTIDDQFKEKHHTDKYGKKISAFQWTILVERADDYRRIGMTALHNVVISTVWIGMIGMINNVFETAVLTKEAGWDVVDRYPTLKSALAGHKRIVKKYESK